MMRILCAEGALIVKRSFPGSKVAQTIKIYLKSNIIDQLGSLDPPGGVGGWSGPLGSGGYVPGPLGSQNPMVWSQVRCDQFTRKFFSSSFLRN